MTSGNAKEFNRALLLDRPIKRLQHQVGGILRKTMGSWRLGFPRRVVTDAGPHNNRHISIRARTASSIQDPQLAGSLLDDESFVGSPPDFSWMQTASPVLASRPAVGKPTAAGLPPPENSSQGLGTEMVPTSTVSAENHKFASKNGGIGQESGAAGPSGEAEQGNAALLTPSRAQVQVWLQKPKSKCSCLGPTLGPWFDELR